MKTTPIHWTAALLATLALHPLQAQEERPGPPSGHRPPMPLIGVLDADHDHKISAAEIKAASAAILTLDADGDGSVSAEELRPKPPEGKDGGEGAGAPPPPPAPAPPGEKGGQPPAPPVLAAIDSDHDGALSAKEIEAAATALQTLDANGDGELTPDEFGPKPPPRGEEGQEGQRPHGRGPGGPGGPQGRGPRPGGR